MGYNLEMRVRAWLTSVLLLVGCGHTTLIVFEQPDGGSDAMVHPGDGGKEGDAREDANEGGVTTLASKQLLPLAITLSPDTVYWTDVGVVNDAGVEQDTGSIWEVSRKGGMPGVLVPDLTDPEALQYGLAGIPGGALAWSESNGATGSVGTRLLATKNSNELSGLSMPMGVAIAGDQVYWVSSNIGGSGVLVTSAPLAGGATTTLGFTEDGNQPGFIAVTPEGTTRKRDIFVTGVTLGGGGVVYAMPIEGGAMEAIWTTTAGEPYGIVADETRVYWAVPNVADGTIYQMTNLSPFDAGTFLDDATVVEKDGGPGFAMLTVLARSLSNSFFLAVDSTHVYFTTNVSKSGGVYSVPIGGGTVRTLASDLSFPGGVAADDSDDFVYFTTLDSVARVHK
jgi:hypothetical protein